jgi:hypothetical protein
MLAITIIILLVDSQLLYCFEANQFNQPSSCYAIGIIYYFIFQAIGPPVLMLLFAIGTFIHIRQGQQVQ